MLSVRHALLSAQSALQAPLEAVQHVSVTLLKLQESATVTLISTRVDKLVPHVTLSAMAVLIQGTRIVKPVLLISIQSPAQTPASLLVLTTPTITTLTTLSVGSAILSVPRVLERATLFAQPVLQASTQFKERQPPV